MYWTTHVAVGAALGAKSRSRRGAFIKGVLSHPLLDAIPHYDFEFWPLSLADFLLGLALVEFLSDEGRDVNTIFGAFGAGMPDIEGGLTFFHLLPQRWAFFHKIFPHARTDPLRSLAQEALIVGAVYLLFNRRQKKV